MKAIKLLALLVCTSSLLLTGCKTCCNSGKAESSCGHKCCADNHTDCAHCPVCSAKK